MKHEELVFQPYPPTLPPQSIANQPHQFSHIFNVFTYFKLLLSPPTIQSKYFALVASSSSLLNLAPVIKEWIANLKVQIENKALLFVLHYPFYSAPDKSTPNHL